MNEKLIAVRRPESLEIEPYRDNALSVLAAENEVLKTRLAIVTRKQQVYTEAYNLAVKVIGWAATIVWGVLNVVYATLLLMMFFFYMGGTKIHLIAPSTHLFVLVMSMIYFIRYMWVWFTEPTNKGKSHDW